MNVLFVHNNFPAQYKHMVAALLADPASRVAAIGAPTARDITGVDLHRYDLKPGNLAGTHPFARRFDIECRRAEQVLYRAADLLRAGFRPDTVVAHSGWGETLPLRAVFSNVRIVNYCEFFYRRTNQDVDFDPEFPTMSLDGVAGLAVKNAAMLGLVEADAGLAPTEWQRATFPSELRSKITVIHEGIDVEAVRPDPNATFDLPSGQKVAAGDEVITFVSRNLEPLRGYHSFMRALPKVLRSRPQAQVIVVGGDGVSYGPPAPAGETWKTIYLDRVKHDLDLSRVHFLGRIGYTQYLRLLQVSAAHVYLTYPFVLSWSLLEAMSAECLVIGADVAPVREVVDARNGILVPFFDRDALAEAMIDALRTPARHRPLRTRARATILERFDARVCVPAALKLLAGD